MLGSRILEEASIPLRTPAVIIEKARAANMTV